MTEKDKDAIKKLLVEAEGMIEVGGEYRHFKGGEYVVRDIVVIEADGCAGVVYESMDNGTRWVRKVKNFCEEIETDDGGKQKRFEKVKKGKKA